MNETNQKCQFFRNLLSSDSYDQWAAGEIEITLT